MVGRMVGLQTSSMKVLNGMTDCGWRRPALRSHSLASRRIRAFRRVGISANVPRTIDRRTRRSLPSEPSTSSLHLATHTLLRLPRRVKFPLWYRERVISFLSPDARLGSAVPEWIIRLAIPESSTTLLSNKVHDRGLFESKVLTKL